MAVRTKIPKQTKAQKQGEVQRVYLVLREWLITARLAPGEFLSEADLAARCKTSRTPIREACSRLAQDKWLSLIRRKGYLVNPISVRDIVELYEYRKLLECFAAEKVAQSATPDEVAELKSILMAETAANSELRDILAANARFHLRLAELAGNQRVIDQLRLTLGYVRRLDTLCTQTVPGWIAHDEIMRELDARSAEGARQAMATHIDLSRDKMIKLFSS
jgi:DNA-binding GntR family transcriptional regulator